MPGHRQGRRVHQLAGGAPGPSPAPRRAPPSRTPWTWKAAFSDIDARTRAAARPHTPVSPPMLGLLRPIIRGEPLNPLRRARRGRPGAPSADDWRWLLPPIPEQRKTLRTARTPAARSRAAFPTLEESAAELTASLARLSTSRPTAEASNRMYTSSGCRFLIPFPQCCVVHYN